MFDNKQEALDHEELMREIENMPYADPPCWSYPEAFFDEDKPDGQRGATIESNMAKKLCFGCEARLACAAYAIKWNVDGIWGGLSHGERRAIRRKRGLDDRIDR